MYINVRAGRFSVALGKLPWILNQVQEWSREHTNAYMYTNMSQLTIHVIWTIVSCIKVSVGMEDQTEWVSQPRSKDFQSNTIIWRLVSVRASYWMAPLKPGESLVTTAGCGVLALNQLSGSGTFFR
jgi:hypothetical protein